MHILSADEITRLLPITDAIDVVADAFAAISRNDGLYPRRLHMPIRGGDALVMPGYDGRGRLGTKIVTVCRRPSAQSGTRATYLLLDADSAEPLLVCDGTALTTLRTGAATGLATRRLARKDANTLALFGVGRQASSQLAGVLAVRPIEEIQVVARDHSRAEAFVSDVRLRFPQLRVRITDPTSAVLGARVIVTATTSTTPVFDGSTVTPGTHINAIGSFRPDMRELDDVLLKRARLVVDQKDAAFAEAGEFVDALAQGLLNANDIVELGDLTESSPRDDAEITVFKSVGHAALDLVTAGALLERLSAI